MIRQPTIHVKVSDLVTVLDNIGFVVTEPMNLLKALKPYQIQNRSQVTVKSDKLRKKAQKSIDADNPITEQFNGILNQTRMELKHRNIRPIKKEDRDYIMLKEIAQLAQTFCTEFEVSLAQGLKDYCEIGIQLMGKVYGINKFKYYHDKICNMYEALTLVEKDESPKNTKHFYELWQATMYKHTTMNITLETWKYANMVFARREADEADADYQDWIDAQFEGLAFLSAIPEISQLHGENAKSRYTKYMIHVKAKENAEPDVDVVYSSDAERDYWKLLTTKADG